VNFIKKYFPNLIVILLPLMFEQKTLYTFVYWVWVKPISQHILDNICISALLISIISYLYCIGFFQRKSKFLLTALLTVIIIMAQTWKYWEFKGYYWTMPFLLLIIYTISDFFAKKKKKKKNSPDDELNREGFAASILEDIKSKKDIEHSYNYGLVGEWGSGKTFLMEMMYEKMKNEPKTFITYYFKPWETPNEKEFAIQILNGIKLNSENYELETKINKFLTKIETDSSDVLTKTLTSLFSWLISDDSSIDDIKRDLSAYLKKNDKRLVVFLDDLDRLDQSEIKELLRLMRNTFDIPYLFFVVGFDRNYLTNILGFNDNEFDNYISKFFQVKTNVPLLNKTDLFNKYYKDKICAILSRDPNNIQEKEEFRNIITENILELIDTPRDYENIIASFDLSYRNLKNNCDSFTLFQLEVLKNTNYYMYDFIKSNGISLLDNIDILIKDNKISEKIKPVIYAIEISSNNKGNYKFWDNKYFNKYFSLVNASYEIDISEFEKTVMGPINLLDVKILYWRHVDKYGDLDTKLTNYIYHNNDLTAAFLWTVDFGMSIGPYKRRYVYEPVYYYFVRNYKHDACKDILKEVKQSHTATNISRTIGYYFISDDVDSIILDIETQFNLLLTNEKLSDNDVYWFISHVYSWIHNTYYPDTNLIDISSIDRNRDKVTEILEKGIFNFAQKDIKAFLLNFICPLASSNRNIESFTFYNKYVPEIISESDTINSLQKLQQDDDVMELINFLQSPKDMFGHYKFSFIHNRIIKD